MGLKPSVDYSVDNRFRVQFMTQCSFNLPAGINLRVAWRRTAKLMARFSAMMAPMEKAMTGNQNDSTNASSNKKEQTAELTSEARERLRNQAVSISLLCGGLWWG